MNRSNRSLLGGLLSISIFSPCVVGKTSCSGYLGWRRVRNVLALDIWAGKELEMSLQWIYGLEMG